MCFPIFCRVCRVLSFAVPQSIRFRLSTRRLQRAASAPHLWNPFHAPFPPSVCCAFLNNSQSLSARFCHSSSSAPFSAERNENSISSGISSEVPVSSIFRKLGKHRFYHRSNAYPHETSLEPVRRSLSLRGRFEYCLKYLLPTAAALESSVSSETADRASSITAFSTKCSLSCLRSFPLLTGFVLRRDSIKSRANFSSFKSPLFRSLSIACP